LIDAECVLSTIAKFLVHLLGKGKGRCVMGERRGSLVGKKSEKGSRRAWRGRKWECTKK